MKTETQEIVDFLDSLREGLPKVAAELVQLQQEKAELVEVLKEIESAYPEQREFAKDFLEWFSDYGASRVRKVLAKPEGGEPNE